MLKENISGSIFIYGLLIVKFGYFKNRKPWTVDLTNATFSNHFHTIYIEYNFQYNSIITRQECVSVHFTSILLSQSLQFHYVFSSDVSSICLA